MFKLFKQWRARAMAGRAAPRSRRKKSVKPAPFLESLTPAPKERKPRVALVVGHNQSAGGAYSKHLGANEFHFMDKVAGDMVARCANIDYKAFHRTPGGGYTSQINRVYASVKSWKPDLIISMHFNAGGGNYAWALVPFGCSKSVEVARNLTTKASVRLGGNYKEPAARRKGDRGGYELERGGAVAPTVLIEPFFGDNIKHCKLVENTDLVEMIKQPIEQYLGREGWKSCK